MSYELTLSSGERQAIDWVITRQASGNGLVEILQDHMPDGDTWDSEDEITWDLPDHVSYVVLDLADGNDGRWLTFEDPIRAKMLSLCEGDLDGI